MAELKINETFDEIEDILSKMEEKDISLEDSFKLYEEGMKKLKECNDKITGVEQKIQKLNASGQFEDFDPNQ